MLSNIIENRKKIDKIFIINLKHRTDRKEHMLREIEKHGIKNFEFFDAIRPTSEEVDEWNPKYCHYIMRFFPPAQFEHYRRGCLGCLKSHLGVIKLALARGYKRILVLEDDTEFIQPWSNFHKFCRPLKDYDMLYLSGSHLKPYKKVPTMKYIVKVIGINTTGSYCIGERAMRFCVDNIIGYTKEIDTFYRELIQPKFDCYCIMPHMTKQLPGYSDIQGISVNYKLN